MHAPRIPKHDHRHRSPGAAAAALLATVVVASSALLVGSPSPASAGAPVVVPILVETTDDVVDPGDGLRSLREAFDEANSDGVPSGIVLADGATYLLDECGGGTDENANVGGDLDHTAEEVVQITGNGATIEQTCANERVVHDFHPDLPILVEDVRITGGRSLGSGGGIMAGGWAGLYDAVVEGNVSAGPSGGGGVAANLGFEAADSTIRDNVAVGVGGGVRANDQVILEGTTIEGNRSGSDGGGTSSSLLTRVRRSTITGNQAGTTGGGVSSSSDDVEVIGSTVTANRAPDGSNVRAANSVVLEGSIVALGAGSPDCASGDPVVNDGGNVGYDASCGASGPDDVPALHPMVALLAPGVDAPTPLAPAGDSMAPTVGSPSVDRYAPSCATTHDQHLVARPLGGACDSGSVEATPPACAPTFDDVSAAHPFFEEICWLAQSGITSGYGDGSFGAGTAVSRQAMAAFLYRLALEPPLPGSLVSFSDVGPDHPFVREIAWLAEEDISNGYGDNTFRPNDPVTRQAMAAFLYRIAGEPPAVLPPAPSFPDVPLDHPFAIEVEWMADTGISTGYEDGTWHPGSPVTRQAMAAFLLRMAEDVQLRGL